MQSKAGMDIDNLKNKERAFILTTDPEHGQAIAAKAGFTPTSPSVAFSENRSIMREWAKLKALGVLEMAETHSGWYINMVESLVGHDLPEIFKLQQRATMMTFFTASLLAMHRDGIVTVNDMDKVSLTEVILDPKTKEQVVPEDYEAVMAELELLMQAHLLVDEPEILEERAPDEQ